MTINELVATTAAATAALQEAGRDGSVAVVDATIEGQERALRLVRALVDESQAAAARQKQLLEAMGVQVQKGQEAVLTLVRQNYLAGGVAARYHLPFALSD